VWLQRLLRSERAFDFLDAPIQSTTADTPTILSCFIKEWLPNADDVIKAVKSNV
jgi:pyruvate/2-oxoglutarate/acetoin dehydrogenase E1 component